MKNLTIERADSKPVFDIKDGYELLKLAQGWLKQGNPIVAFELLNSAVDSREANVDKKLRACILKELGRGYMMQSDWEQADFLYLEAQRLFIEINDNKGAAESIRNRANMNFQKGNFKEAENLCEIALDYASKDSDYEIRATIFNTLGAIKSVTGELEEAIKILKLCLADFESADNTIRQGHVILNIGLTYIELSDYQQAIQYFNKSLAIALEIRDQNLLEICYQNIAKCYFEQKELSLARAVIKTARKILPGLNSKSLTIELNLLEGKILMLSGNQIGAESILNDAYKAAIESNQKALEADILIELGILSKEQNKAGKANSHVKAAMLIYKEIGMEGGFKKAVQILESLKGK